MVQFQLERFFDWYIGFVLLNNFPVRLVFRLFEQVFYAQLLMTDFMFWLVFNVNVIFLFYTFNVRTLAANSWLQTVPWKSVLTLRLWFLYYRLGKYNMHVGWVSGCHSSKLIWSWAMLFSFCKEPFRKVTGSNPRCIQTLPYSLFQMKTPWRKFPR